MSALFNALSNCFGGLSRAIALADAVPLSDFESVVQRRDGRVHREYWTAECQHVGKVSTTRRTRTVDALVANDQFEARGWNIGRQLLAAAVHDMEGDEGAETEKEVFVRTLGRSPLFDNDAELACFSFDEDRQGYVCAMETARACTERDWRFAQSGTRFKKEDGEDGGNSTRNMFETWRRDTPWV